MSLTETLARRLVPTRIGRILLRLRSGYERRRLAASDFPVDIAVAAQGCCNRLLMTRIPVRGELFVDVGSHIGSVLSGVIATDPRIRLVAIEAIAEKAKSLRRRFPSCSVIHSAVGEQNGEVDFAIQIDRSGFSSIASGSQGQTGSRVRVSRVPLGRLDDLLAGHGSPNFVKIDVEGAELGVLRGADRAIGDARPVVFFESGPGGGRRFGYPDNGVYQWFAEREFEVTLPDRLPHEAPGLSEDAFLDAHHYPRRSIDFVAIPMERREQVRSRCRTVVRSAGVSV